MGAAGEGGGGEANMMLSECWGAYVERQECLCRNARGGSDQEARMLTLLVYAELEMSVGIKQERSCLSSYI